VPLGCSVCPPSYSNVNRSHVTKPLSLTGYAAELRAFATSLPEVTEDFPWGERAWKVGGKAFVFLSVSDGLSFSVKLPKTGKQALMLAFTEPTHYGLGRHGWVTVRPPMRLSRAVKDQCRDWIVEIYTAVAPARLRKVMLVEKS
jgi:hypothetical protein